MTRHRRRECYVKKSDIPVTDIYYFYYPDHISYNNFHWRHITKSFIDFCMLLRFYTWKKTWDVHGISVRDSA